MEEDRAPWWVYVLIPVLSGLVGYGTNVLAVIMTFQPLEFWPLKVYQQAGQPWGLFGWQGIIPAKAVEMTEILCEVFMDKVIDMDEVFSKVDPKRVAALTHDRMQDTTRELVDKVARSELPDVWVALSKPVKDEILQALLQDSERFIEILVVELQMNIRTILDMKGLMASIVANDKQVLCDMFLRTGGEEFDFIRRSGFYFGFLFGLFQTLVYYFYDAAWVLPVAGFAVGYFTNWVALKLIFEPAAPVNLGFYTLQGLFLKRQQEAAKVIAAFSLEYFLVQDYIWNEVFFGKNQNKWHALLQRATDKYMRQQVQQNAQGRVAAAVLLGEAHMQRIARVATEHIAGALPQVLPCTYAYMEATMDVQNTIRVALQAMPAPDFIGILRPAFQADEWKLIIVGGILGAAAGAIQQFALFDNVA